jgi:hypothetical protein
VNVITFLDGSAETDGGELSAGLCAVMDVLKSSTARGAHKIACCGSFIGSHLSKTRSATWRIRSQRYWRRAADHLHFQARWQIARSYMLGAIPLFLSLSSRCTRETHDRPPTGTEMSAPGGKPLLAKAAWEGNTLVVTIHFPEIKQDIRRLTWVVDADGQLVMETAFLGGKPQAPTKDVFKRR